MTGLWRPFSGVIVYLGPEYSLAFHPPSSFPQHLIVSTICSDLCSFITKIIRSPLNLRLSKQMDGFEITQFLRELPRVALGDVPSESRKCPICQIKYLEEDTDSGYTEHPTVLPCNHIIGRHCLTRWLKPTPGGNANTCPLCRLKLFDSWPAPPESESETSGDDEIESVEQNERPTSNHIARLSISIAREHGYPLEPYLGHIEDKDARPLELRRIAAHRRAVSLHEADLYFELEGMGVDLASDLAPGELLDYDQDQALFGYLQRHGAFRGICLNEEFREELEGPMRGDRLDDYAIWSRLRDRGIYWRVDDMSQATGRWITRLGEVLYPQENEYSPNIFEELLRDGAFSTRAIDREFRSQGTVSNYRIFRELVELARTWDASRRLWISRSDEGSGDLDSEGEEQVTPRQRRGPRVIHTTGVSPTQTIRRQDPRRRLRLWDGRPAGWSDEQDCEEMKENRPSSEMDVDYKEWEDDSDEKVEDDE